MPNQVLQFTPQEYQRRQLKIRAGMQLRDIDCLVIAGNDAFYGAFAADLVYLTGSYPHQMGYIVFPLEGEAINFGDFSAGGEGIRPAMAPFKKGKGAGRSVADYAAAIAGSIKELGYENGRIGISDMRGMPAGIYLELVEHLPRAKFVPAGDILLECRRIKSAEELEFFRTAAAALDKGFEAIFAAARPGATDRDLYNSAEMAMIQAGARRGNFMNMGVFSWEEKLKNNNLIIGLDVQLAMINPIRKIHKGDIVLDEISCNYHGYNVQQCIAVSIGIAANNMPDSFKETFSFHQEIYELARKELRAGNWVVDIEKKLKALALSRGRPDFIFAVQSAELDEAFHTEADVIELKPGMVWVIHPWTQVPPGQPGFSGHLLGNSFIVTEKEPEALSRLPLDLVVV